MARRTPPSVSVRQVEAREDPEDQGDSDRRRASRHRHRFSPQTELEVHERHEKNERRRIYTLVETHPFGRHHFFRKRFLFVSFRVFAPTAPRASRFASARGPYFRI